MLDSGVGLDLCLRCAGNERRPIRFSSVRLLCQSDFSVWFTSDTGLNAVCVWGKSAALVSVLLLLFQVAKGKLMILSLIVQLF